MDIKGVQMMKDRSRLETERERSADGKNGIKKKGKIRREPVRNKEKQLPMIVHRI